MSSTTTNSKSRRQHNVTLEREESTGTTSSIGMSVSPLQTPQPVSGSILASDYPLLGRLLQSTPGVDSIAPIAENEDSTANAQRVVTYTNLSGAKTTNTIQTRLATSSGKALKLRLSNPAPTPYHGDVNKRGKTYKIQDLVNYLVQHKLYTAEQFIDHATQGRENEGTRIYVALAVRDWDKKIQQALDIARSFTPDISYRARIESYTIPSTFDREKGDYTYGEYMDLFAHHGITIDKLSRWFSTLFSDNGKRNTIYMWGKADAGKTTIIKLFDAFYESWEIGRCSAQSINSNFWLQDLYLKRLFHADEILATQVNIDTLKLLLEGSDDLTTDIKYAKKVSVKGRPVMMATNDPIWIHMSSAADPIKRRCEYVHMTRAWNKRSMYMHTKDKTILKYVLKRLYDTCFPRGYASWKNDLNMREDHFALIAELESIQDYVSEMN